MWAKVLRLAMQSKKQLGRKGKNRLQKRLRPKFNVERLR